MDNAVENSQPIVDVTPDYREIDCYMITIDRNSPDIDFISLKKKGFIGVIIEEGCYFDTVHTKNKKYVNPNLEKQVSKVKNAELPYGFYTYIKAKNIKEANDELSMLRIYASKYTPPLGIWLIPGFSAFKPVNDDIISFYKESLERAGYYDKMGFYATRTQLKTITWSKWKGSFLLMLNDHVSDVSQLQQLLTPEFFMLNKR